MKQRTLPHPFGGTITEHYSHEVAGQCKCGFAVTKVFGSSTSLRIDKVRYMKSEKPDAWGLFRCPACKEAIEDTWTPLKSLADPL